LSEKMNMRFAFLSHIEYLLSRKRNHQSKNNFVNFAYYNKLQAEKLVLNLK
jgi:hypothetical protein